MNKLKHTSFKKFWVWFPPLIMICLMGLVYFTRSNTSLFFQINNFSQYTGDTFWACLTIFGDTAIGVLLLLPWIRKRSDIVWVAVLAGIFALLGSQGLKHLLSLKRPPALLPQETFHLIGPKYCLRSFPSGHTTTIFTILGVCILGISRTWLRLALLISASLIGISRVVVGVHWPLDVLGGALVGWTAALVGYTLAESWSWGRRTFGQRVLALCLLATATIVLLTYHTGYQQTLLFQRILALVFLLWGGFEYFHLLREQRGEDILTRNVKSAPEILKG